MYFKKNKRFLALSFVFLMFLTLASGCTNKTKENPPASNKEEKTEDKMDENKNKMDSKSTELNKRSQKIADQLVKIDGIEKARVVISEKRALVGVTIPSSAEGKITDELKNKVKETTKNTDKEIETVAVSADADTYKRISEIGDGLNEGKGLEEFASQIKELFNRITPQ
ncbi:YhcN/YlaJ family sporulation lipoprotein [Clostridium oceanicum]|uniref:YhcN/YlaJ family sporulation lipoprotein n=1 Tax=Clostridium oceanicum TaxID=1543 RepID=A0ABN1JR55_9CLOT